MTVPAPMAALSLGQVADLQDAGVAPPPESSGRHLHRPGKATPEERHVAGSREVRPICEVCGEPMAWRRA